MPDNQSLFKVIVQAIDQASGPIEQIKEHLRATNSPVLELGRNLARLAELPVFSKLEAGFGHLSHSIGHVAGQLGALATPFAALGGLASIAGLIDTAIRVGDAGREIADTATKIGVSAEEFQKLRSSARASGIDVETMTGSMEKLNVAIGEAADGKHKSVADIFAKIGVGLRDANGQLKDGAQLLPKISDWIAKHKNISEDSPILKGLFGRSGIEMLPWLQQGGGNISQALAGQANMSDAQVAKAREFSIAFGKFQNSLRGITTAIGSALIPVLEPVIEHMTKWLAINQKLITTKLDHVFKAIGDEIDKIDWDKLITGISNTVEKITTWMGGNLGLKGTLIAVTAAMGAPLLSAIAGIGTAIASLTVFLVANPVAVILGGLGLVAVEIINHWSEIGPFFDKLFDDIGKRARELREELGGIVKDLFGGHIGKLALDISNSYDDTDVTKPDKFGNSLSGAKPPAADGAPTLGDQFRQFVGSLPSLAPLQPIATLALPGGLGDGSFSSAVDRLGNGQAIDRRADGGGLSPSAAFSQPGLSDGGFSAAIERLSIRGQLQDQVDKSNLIADAFRRNDQWAGDQRRPPGGAATDHARIDVVFSNTPAGARVNTTIISGSPRVKTDVGWNGMAPPPHD